MALNKGMFTSKRDEWETPPGFFERIDKEFGFTLDVCATKLNAKCHHFFSVKEDGLAQPWIGRCWMNPPYGRAISRWMQKAYESRMAAELVVCLIPARTDTRWWHDYVMLSSEIRLVRGRLRFLENGMPAEHCAPFPSAVVVFRDCHAGTPDLSSMES